MEIKYPTATRCWLAALDYAWASEYKPKPRGFETRDRSNVSVTFNGRFPVVNVPERMLSSKFMAAEALWIMDGLDTVKTIAPYNRNIAQFSDDSKTFFGAYGPPWCDQLEYLAQTLIDDPYSRQAVATIWRQNPPKTKDVPCTIALAFRIRENKIDSHVFMRSSDVWLGLPYDMFNFAMLTAQLVNEINTWAADFGTLKFRYLYNVGDVTITCVSSHLYERDKIMIEHVLRGDTFQNHVAGHSFLPPSRERMPSLGNTTWHDVIECVKWCRDFSAPHTENHVWRVRPAKREQS